MRRFSIRLARMSEARRIAVLSRDLIEAGLGWSWTPQRVMRSLRDRATNVVVAVDGQRVVAFALMKYLEEEAHLMLLAVLPTWRRAGVGRAMLAWLEETALTAGICTIHLEVRANNRGARAFYRRFGFEECETLPGYYGAIEAALRMRSDLWENQTGRSARGQAAWRPPT